MMMRVSLLNLKELGRPALSSFWEETFQRPPPPSTSQDMMRLIIGWEIQAKVSRSDVRALNTAVKQPGTRLSREWQGRTYIVDVLDKGFTYQGKLFSSLSPIAKVITGSHRSGPLFFGISK